MLSRIPVDIEGMRKGDLDKEILRVAIIVELDAINLYEQVTFSDLSIKKKKDKLVS